MLRAEVFEILDFIEAFDVMLVMLLFLEAVFLGPFFIACLRSNL